MIHIISKPCNQRILELSPSKKKRTNFLSFRKQNLTGKVRAASVSDHRHHTPRHPRLGPRRRPPHGKTKQQVPPIGAAQPR